MGVDIVESGQPLAGEFTQIEEPLWPDTGVTAAPEAGGLDERRHGVEPFGVARGDDEISGDGFSFESGIPATRRRAHPFQGAVAHACCGAPIWTSSSASRRAPGTPSAT